jgi:pimeloyl-ACP methyl ester carboxylesterase
MDSNYQEKIYIIFLHGFMSNIEGEKPKAIFKYAKKNNLGFLALEYSGHGKSTGKFIKGNISKWSKEVKITIKRIVKKNKFILVGSSMGAWLSLNQFKYFKEQIKGFLGIGSAPEFLQNLMWKKFSKKMKSETIKKGIYHLKHGDYEYPITYQLIKDGRKNKILNKKILFNIDVTMIHGSKDEVVPPSYSKKVLKIFSNAKKKLVVIKNGDHSLSNKKGLKRIVLELNKIISNII